MSFSLGGLITGVAKFADQKFLGGVVEQGISAAQGIYNAVKQQARPTIGPPPMPSFPQLPTLSGGGLLPSSARATTSSTPGTGVATIPIPYSSSGQSDVQSGGSVVYSQRPKGAKSTYGHFTKTGRWIRTNAKGKALRRMNYANGRAIARSTRRLHGAVKMFKRVISVTHPGHKKGARFTPRARRRKAS